MKMNVSELYDLTYWILENIESANIQQKYQNIYSILNQHTQPNQPKRPFDEQKTELLEALKEVPLNKLTSHQLEFLNELGIGEAVGTRGIDLVEDILYRNALDVATAAQRFQEIIQKLTKGLQKNNQIKTGLDDCVNYEEYESNNEVLIRVTFSGEAAIANVKDLKSSANIWFEIGRGISMAHNLSPEDIKITGATKGSIVIEMAVIASVASTASYIILSVLKIAEKVMEIRKKAAEIRNLNLQNEKIASELEKEVAVEKKAGIDKISIDLTNKLKLNNGSQGDKINALSKAIKNLVEFIETGGAVDFIVPETDNNTDETNESDELKNMFKQIRSESAEIRQLEHQVKLLTEKVYNNDLHEDN